MTEEYLERFDIPVIAEIDTRAVVRHLRTYGALRGVISSLETDPDKLILKARDIRKMDGTDLAKVVSTKASYAVGLQRPAQFQWRSSVAGGREP